MIKHNNNINKVNIMEWNNILRERTVYFRFFSGYESDGERWTPKSLKIRVLTRQQRGTNAILLAGVWISFVAKAVEEFKKKYNPRNEENEKFHLHNDGGVLIKYIMVDFSQLNFVIGLKTDSEMEFKRPGTSGVAKLLAVGQAGCLSYPTKNQSQSGRYYKRKRAKLKIMSLREKTRIIWWLHRSRSWTATKANDCLQFWLTELSFRFINCLQPWEQYHYVLLVSELIRDFVFSRRLLNSTGDGNFICGLCKMGLVIDYTPNPNQS